MLVTLVVVIIGFRFALFLVELFLSGGRRH